MEAWLQVAVMAVGAPSLAWPGLTTVVVMVVGAPSLAWPQVVVMAVGAPGLAWPQVVVMAVGAPGLAWPGRRWQEWRWVHPASPFPQQLIHSVNIC